MKILSIFCITLLVIASRVRGYLITFNTTWSFTTPTTRDHSLHPFFGVTRYDEYNDPRLFEGALRSNAYVDKSLIIKDLVADEHKNILINCPRNFGRSTTLDIVRKFFEIIVHVDRAKIANKTRTRNYRVFNNPYYKISISEDKKFFEQHFYTHPVIYVDLSPVLGVHADGIINSLKLSIQEAFMNYDYIPNLMKKKLGKKMPARDKTGLNLFQKLADTGFEEEDLDISIETLVEYVHRFHEKKAIVMIDDIDGGVTFAINEGLVKGVADVIRFIRLMIDAFTSFPEHVERTIITGTSRMYLANATTNLSKIHCYDFLEDHQYAKYFGFSQKEVDALFEKHYVDDKRRKDVKEYYSGYTVKNSNLTLYCPFDIFAYVTEGNYRLNNSWIQKGEEYNEVVNRHRKWFKLSRYLKYESLLRNITALLSAKRIQFPKLVNVAIDDIQTFAEMINGTKKKKSFLTRPFPVNMYLTYLYEHGFLSVTNEENVYRIPNKQIEDEFHKEYKLFFSNHTLNITDEKLLQDIKSILK